MDLAVQPLNTKRSVEPRLCLFRLNSYDIGNQPNTVDCDKRMDYIVHVCLLGSFLQLLLLRFCN